MLDSGIRNREQEINLPSGQKIKCFFTTADSLNTLYYHTQSFLDTIDFEQPVSYHIETIQDVKYFCFNTGEYLVYVELQPDTLEQLSALSFKLQKSPYLIPATDEDIKELPEVFGVPVEKFHIDQNAEALRKAVSSQEGQNESPYMNLGSQVVALNDAKKEENDKANNQGVLENTLAAASNLLGAVDDVKEREVTPEQTLQSLINQNVDIHSQMPENQVIEIEVYQDYPMKCLYSTKHDDAFHSFISQMGSVIYSAVHFTGYENNTEFVSFCTATHVLLVPAASDDQVNDTLAEIKNTEVYFVSDEDSSLLFKYFKFDLLNQFALKDKLTPVREELPKQIEENFSAYTKDSTMTYSTFFNMNKESISVYHNLAIKVENVPMAISLDEPVKEPQEEQPKVTARAALLPMIEEVIADAIEVAPKSIFKDNFDVHLQFPLNKVEEIEVMPEYNVKCLYSTEHDQTFHDFLQETGCDRYTTIHKAGENISFVTSRHVLLVPSQNTEQINDTLYQIQRSGVYFIDEEDQSELFKYFKFDLLHEFGSKLEVAELRKGLQEHVQQHFGNLTNDDSMTYSKFFLDNSETITAYHELTDKSTKEETQGSLQEHLENVTASLFGVPQQETPVVLARSLDAPTEENVHKSLVKENFDVHSQFPLNKVEQVEILPEYDVKCLYSTEHDQTFHDFLQETGSQRYTTIHKAGENISFVTSRHVLLIPSQNTEQINDTLYQIQRSGVYFIDEEDQSELFKYFKFDLLHEFGSKLEVAELRKGLQEHVQQHFGNLTNDDSMTYSKFFLDNSETITAYHELTDKPNENVIEATFASITDVLTKEVQPVEEEEEDKSDDNKQVLQNSLRELTDNLIENAPQPKAVEVPFQGAKEYVYSDREVDLTDDSNLHQQYQLNEVTEMKVAPNHDNIRCVLSETEPLVLNRYVHFLKLGKVATIHFSVSPDQQSRYFSFCTGRDLVGLVNPAPEQIDCVLKKLSNTYVVPCSQNDVETLRSLNEISPIRRPASKNMVKFVEREINSLDKVIYPNAFEYDESYTYSRFMNVTHETYLGYLIASVQDECERLKEQATEYTYSNEFHSIFQQDFKLSDKMGINNVCDLELAPHTHLRCVLSCVENLVFDQFIRFLKPKRVVSIHFSQSPNHNVSYFTFCTGKDLIALVNPTFEQLNAVFDKIKNSFVIPCATSDSQLLNLYDFTGKVKHVLPAKKVPNVVEELEIVSKALYPTNFDYDVAFSYAKFLNISYNTFLGYYLRKNYFEARPLPYKFAEYSMDEFIHIRNLRLNLSQVLHKETGEFFTLKKYNDSYQFNQALYTYKTHRSPAISSCYGRIKGSSHLVFDFAPRGTLRDVITDNCYIPIKRCRTLTIELVFALAYLHLTGVQPGSVSIDHVSVGWNYAAKMTDYDEYQKAINCTPESLDIHNLREIIYKICTCQTSIPSKGATLPTLYGPVTRIFELCNQPDITACDLVSAILADKDFRPERPLIDFLLSTLPFKSQYAIEASEGWIKYELDVNCSEINKLELDNMKIMDFGPVTSFHFVPTDDEENRIFTFSTKGLCGVLHNVTPEVMRIILSKMEHSLVIPVCEKDLDTLFDYVYFDKLRDFCRDPQLSQLQSQIDENIEDMNEFENKEYLAQTIAIEKALVRPPQPKPLHPFTEISLFNPRFNIHSSMESDKVKDVEIFNDFVVSCLHSTSDNNVFNKFIAEFGNEPLTSVAFTENNENEEFVSFCNSRQDLLIRSSNVELANKAIDQLSNTKFYFPTDEDRTKLFRYFKFDKIQEFANIEETQEFREKLSNSDQLLPPTILVVDPTMTYSTFVTLSLPAVTGYYILTNPDFEPPNFRARDLDRSFDNSFQTLFGVDGTTDSRKAFELYKKAAENGDPAALFNLGLMYSRGEGVKRDKRIAAEYYQQAADKGNDKAQFNLGLLYSKGEGVRQNKQRAAELYTKAADQNNKKAQSNLGLMYARGDGVPQNYEKAVELYTKAADQNDADAQLNLGLMYDHGEGVPVNKEKAMELYTKSAEQGNGKAQFNLGVMYHKKDNEKAVQYYSMAAEKGVPQAQYNLGVIYSKGEEDVPVNKEKAVQLFTMAADQGDADAQLNLGSMYAKGDGVPMDKSKTLELYTKAAEQDNAKAQFNLGVMYSRGEGVEQDKAKAAEYYEKAAEHGIQQAKFNLGVMYFKGDGIPEDKAKAAQLFEESIASSKGKPNPKALFNLAVMNQKGEGIPENKERAIELYEKAGELNNRDALLNLGVIYGEGDGVPVDKQKAFDYYKRSADLGNPKAQLNLGHMYQHGDGCPQDREKARKYFEKSAAQGNAQAQLSLGLMLLEQDTQQATDLLERSAEQGNHDAVMNLAHKYMQEDNKARAIELLASAASQGDAKAQCELGRMYLEGDGVDRDLKKAEDFLKQAESNDVTESLLYLGDLYNKLGDKDTARNYYQRALDNKVIGAETRLEDLDNENENDEHVDVAEPLEEEAENENQDDDEEQISKIYQSLEQRIKELHDRTPQVQNENEQEEQVTNRQLNDIGDFILVANEHNTKKGLNDSIKIYQAVNENLKNTVNELNDVVRNEAEKLEQQANSKSKLPVLRRSGQNSPTNSRSTSSLANQAVEAENDDEELVKLRRDVETLENQLSQIGQQIQCAAQEQQRPESPRRSNSPILPYEPMTPQARNIPPSPRSARSKIKSLQRKADEENDAESQYSLGTCYALGDGVPMDKEKAFDYYLMSANQNYKNALLAVASCYSYGKGTQQNKANAFKYYMQAAEQGNPKAQFAIGHFYEYGQGGVEQDHELAKEWYRKAAAQGHKGAKKALTSFSSEALNFNDNEEEEI